MQDTSLTELLQMLLTLSHDLGSAAHEWSILGEGNTSARVDDETFLVKASGSQLSNLTADQLVRVRIEPFLTAIASGDVYSDEDTEAMLKEACVDPGARMPSVETMFHADLLGSFGARFVGHTHVASINSLVCSDAGWSAVQQGYLFPDAIVVCGVAPCFVPYVDPGLALARAIHHAATCYRNEYGIAPKTIYLQNHGLIAVGGSAAEVLAITRMADKAARIMIDALACGSPRFLSAEVVARISGRKDEHLRQRALGLTVTA
jgi:rhamnose utilization protein RhaD (predicted bifunctional aldolase and dehydrogenase)